MRKLLTVLILMGIMAESYGQMLYCVKKKGIKGNSYIMFVDEMLPSSALVGVKDVFRCYNKSEKVVCEYVAEKSWDRWTEMVKSPTSLGALIGKNERELVDSVLRTDCKVTIGKVSKLKPAAIVMMWRDEICKSLYERGEDDVAMDSYFQQVALMEGKKIESLDDSLTIYEYLEESIDVQTRKMVEEFRQGRESVVKRYQRAELLFKAEDIEGLSALHKDENEREKIEARVDGWVEKIKLCVERERCFIVLPAKYFAGELIDKIEKQGYKITEVK